MKVPIWKGFCKILIEIGRIEWPNENPDFIKLIYQLSKVKTLLFNL